VASRSGSLVKLRFGRKVELLPLFHSKRLNLFVIFSSIVNGRTRGTRLRMSYGLTGIQPELVPVSSPLETERRAALPVDIRPRETEGPLIIDPDRVRLDSDAAWLDVAEFEHSYAAVPDISGRSLSAGQARPTAAYLFVDARAVHGLLHRRTALRGGLCAGAGLRHDPAREGTHGRLTRLHCEAGRPCLCDTAVLVWLRETGTGRWQCGIVS
jgi:hypothetical protein